VPPERIRQLRDLTRYRTTLLQERSREAKRLEKELEDAGIKLSSVATDILGVSSRLMLQALIGGERDPAALADMAKARMRRRIGDLTEALIGNFAEHHAFLCRLHLQRIDQITATITELSTRIGEAMAPFRDQLTLLDGVPGIGAGVAEIIIAETGGDLTRFPTAGHLASWAGVCPGMNESAGKNNVRAYPPRQPVARRRPGHRSHGRCENQGHHLHRRPLPAPIRPHRTAGGTLDFTKPRSRAYGFRRPGARPDRVPLRVISRATPRMYAAWMHALRNRGVPITLTDDGTPRSGRASTLRAGMREDGSGSRPWSG